MSTIKDEEELYQNLKNLSIIKMIIRLGVCNGRITSTYLKYKDANNMPSSIWNINTLIRLLFLEQACLVNMLVLGIAILLAYYIKEVQTLFTLLWTLI